LCGSEAYADAMAAAGDNIVAVYNMDMIAYDAPATRRCGCTRARPAIPAMPLI